MAPRPVHYPTDVHPVLDRHCIRCHSADGAQGDLDLSGEMTALFNRSYEALVDRRLVPIIGENHPRVGNAACLPAKSLGSHASKLITTLRSGHYDVEMPREDWVGLTTWVDSNAQYYGSYFGRRNLKYRDHPDFRPVPSVASALGNPPGSRTARP